MKNAIVANSCRVCLSKTKKLRSLYTPMAKGLEQPNKMLQLITGIMIEKADEHETLPKSICKYCDLSLNMAFEFREKALKNQHIIAEYLKEQHKNENSEEKNSLVFVVKSEYEEIVMNAEPLEEEEFQSISNDQNKYSLENDESSEVLKVENNSLQANQIEDEFYNQSETFVMNENNEEEENSNYDYYGHQQTNEANDGTLSDEEEQIECTEDKFEIKTDKEESYAFIQINFKPKGGKSIKKKISKIGKNPMKSKDKQSDMNETENTKRNSRRGRKSSNNTNQNVYVCEICDKKFHTAKLLRKHMYSHCGGKPLKCEFCSRTFFYESVRKAHEAVHKGLKIHTCDVCGKTFNYAHTLKKHQLIHAGIKLYRCDYCNKDFRLRHHKKQHELTKYHKNTVRVAKIGRISFVDCGEMIREEEDLNQDITFKEEISDDDQLTEDS